MDETIKTRRQQISYWEKEAATGFGVYPGETPMEAGWRQNLAKKTLKVLQKGIREVNTGISYCHCCKYETRQYLNNVDCPACGACNEMRPKTETEKICDCGVWMTINQSHCLNCSKSNPLYMYNGSPF